MSPTTQGFELSPQQSLLWRLGGADDPGTFVAWCRITLRGELDEDRLRRAFAQLVERHEILRTRFRSRPGSPEGTQVIDAAEDPRLPILDLRKTSLEGGVVDDLASELAVADEDRRALRATLLRLSSSEHALVLVLPALCADRATLELLFEELARAYELEGEGGRLDAAPVQYADVAAVFRDMARSDEATEGGRFWRRLELSELDDHWLPRLPEEETRHPFRPDAIPIPLLPTLRLRLSELSDTLGAPLSSVALAAWVALVWRLNPVSRAVVGVAADGRTHPKLAEVAGPVGRTLPLVVQLNERTTFAELVASVEESRGRLEEFQDSFDAEEAFGHRPEAGEALLPFTFEWVQPPGPVAAGGVELELDEARCHSQRFLAHCLWREGERLHGELEYDAALFDREHAERLAGRVGALLRDLVDRGPEVSVGGLTVVSDGEREELSDQLTATDSSTGIPKPLHQLIWEQAREAPDRIAVATERRCLSYRELVVRAERLSRHLARAGSGPGTFVGLSTERTPSMVVSLLAILRSGAAVLPLSPGLPPRRLAHVVDETDAEIFLQTGEQELQADLERIDVVEVGPDLVAEPADAPPAPGPPTPCGLAYAIYTSGSTGRPKGVLNTHDSLRNRLEWMDEEDLVEPGDRVLHKTPLSFDASLWEVLGPLTVGARLVLAEPGAHQDAERVAQELKRHQITVLQVVPSFLRVLNREPSFRDNRSLQRLFSGGEALPPAVRDEFVEEIDADAELINLYGPTEVTIDATAWRADGSVGEDGEESSSVPIGEPLANVELYVLDRRMRMVPPGHKGELYVGGKGVTVGYVARPAKTAQSFVPHPFSERPGERLYRTGDLVRMRPDGALQYLGRIDRQLKLRGFRIEPGEIETLLSEEPEVDQCVLELWEREEGDALVAYVVPSVHFERADTTPDALRRALRDRLGRHVPEYMVPSAFVILEDPPLKANGKLDRDALEVPEALPTEGSGGPPRNPVERVVAEIWKEALGLEEIGVEADFFEEGGHSLAATRAVARLRETLDVELEIRSLFRAPKLEDFAVEVQRRLEAEVERPSLEPADRSRPLPLSFSQERLWILDRIGSGAETYSIPTAVRLRGDLDRVALHSGLARLVERHESLRTTFAELDGVSRQVVVERLPRLLTVVDLEGAGAGGAMTAARRQARLMVRRGFDLETGPLLRTALLRLGPRDHVLVVIIHHIVTDGWSTGVLMRELSELYEAFRDGREPDLPQLEIQYGDYAVWQRRWLRDDALEEEIAHWREVLRGAPRSLDLPLDHPRPEEQSYRGAFESVSLSPELGRGVEDLAREQGVTRFMALLAAFAAFLGRISGQEDLLIGTDDAARDDPRLEKLIGFFVNQLVLRARLEGNPTFESLLERIRITTLEAYAHHHVPFQKVVQEVLPDRDASRNPLFQVLFVLNAGMRPELAIDDLELEPFDVDLASSKFDLAVFAAEAEGRLQLTWNYNRDLFDPETVRELAAGYRRLLTAAVEDPSRRIDQLELRSAEERVADESTRRRRKAQKLDKFDDVQPVPVAPEEE